MRTNNWLQHCGKGNGIHKELPFDPHMVERESKRRDCDYRPDPTTDEMKPVRAKAEELGKEIWLFPAGEIGGDESNSKFVRITTVEEFMKEYNEYVVVTETTIEKPFAVIIAAKKLPDNIQIEPGCRIF